MIDFNLYQNGILVKSIKDILINDFKFITFLDDDVQTSMKIKENQVIFARKNDEYELYLEIGQNANAYYHLIQEKLKFMIKIEDWNYKITNNYIKIDYKIESNEYKNTIIIVKK